MHMHNMHMHKHSLQSAACLTAWLGAGGRSWHDSGGTIAGLHGAVVELKNKSLLAFGRGADQPCAVDASLRCQAQSVSGTVGENWVVSASPFPAVHGGQRHVVLRLSEGPILFLGFANGNEPCTKTVSDGCVVNVTSGSRFVFGLFAALTHDEGGSWAHYKLVSGVKAGTPPRPTNGSDDALFYMSSTQGEPAGYVSAKQAADGIIHVITSRNSYGFDLAWLMAQSIM